jgi:signal transduction histidine kinase
MSFVINDETPAFDGNRLERLNTGIGRAGISFIFISYGLLLCSGWLVLTAFSGESAAMWIAVLALSGFALARLLKTRLSLLGVNMIWLITTNVAVFLAAGIVHPAGLMTVILFPLAGFPFALFSLSRERPFVVGMTALPVVLWMVWFGVQDQFPILIPEDIAGSTYAPAAAVTAFSIVILQLLYYANAVEVYASSLEKARRESEQSSRAKTAFLSGISHEMRTPLHTVIGMAGLIRDEARDGGNVQQSEYAAHIAEAGQALLGTVEKTMHFADVAARRVPVTLMPVCVSQSVARVMERYSTEAEERNIMVIPSATDAKVLADPALLDDALAQIVENALRYCGKGGVVGVDVHRHDSERVRIVVSDNGPGFGNFDHDLAFAPFERLDHAAGTTFGAGLGLPIARIKAEVMSGRVGINLGLERGAQVWIELPEFVEDVTVIGGAQAVSH